MLLLLLFTLSDVANAPEQANTFRPIIAGQQGSSSLQGTASESFKAMNIFLRKSKIVSRMYSLWVVLGTLLGKVESELNKRIRDKY